MYDVIRASHEGATLIIDFCDKYDMVAFFRTLKDKGMIREDTNLYHGVNKGDETFGRQRASTVALC